MTSNFPRSPKQVRPGEDIQMTEGRVQVSGQVAVMAINENLMKTLMSKNPGLSFALQESFPFKSTYPGCRPARPDYGTPGSGCANDLHG